MEPIEDPSQLFEYERLADHAERPGFHISELQISPTQQVPWHCHTNVQDTFSGLISRRVYLPLAGPTRAAISLK